MTTEDLLKDLPPFAKVSQVAPILSISARELYRKVERGELPSTRVGEGSVRIPKAELIAWLRERTTTPT